MATKTTTKSAKWKSFETYALHTKKNETKIGKQNEK